jgi:hypothetical protein
MGRPGPGPCLSLPEQESLCRFKRPDRDEECIHQRWERDPKDGNQSKESRSGLDQGVHPGRYEELAGADGKRGVYGEAPQCSRGDSGEANVDPHSDGGGTNADQHDHPAGVQIKLPSDETDLTALIGRNSRGVKPTRQHDALNRPPASHIQEVGATARVS